MEGLKVYLNHIGNCGVKGSDDPEDHRCICGLRNLWLKLTIQNKRPVKVNGM